MKKKAYNRTLSLLLALCLCLALPMAASAKVTTGSAGGSTRWSHDSTARTITFSGTGSTGDYRWSSSDAGKCTYVSVLMKSNKVVVSEGITRLGDSFCGNGGNYVREVQLPNSLTTIGTFAFFNCMKLTSITIPVSVRTIEHGAFAQCGLKDVYYEGTRAQWDAIDKAPNTNFGPGVDGLKNATIHYLGETPYPGTPFTDIADHWGRDSIKWAYEQNLFSGISADQFGPTGTMQRGMIVTVLHRLAGEPAPQKANPFQDVGTTWYTSAVRWAAENAIVNGVSATAFNPEGNVTREQVAQILYGYAVKYGKDTSINPGALSGFSDQGSVSAWAQTAVEWAVTHSVIKGSGGSLNPGGTATRAEVAQIFYNCRDLLA